MKNIFLFLPFCLFIFTATLFTSCTGQEQSKLSKTPPQSKKPLYPYAPVDTQIADYIRNIFQDKYGNFWYGTNGHGVAHYDGDRIAYFSNAEGFGGQQITGITEDLNQNIWFSTNQGVVKYDWSSNADGTKQFTNYTDLHYFKGHRFWSICADSKGNIWAGSSDGIFRFDGKSWKAFDLPYPELVSGEFITKGTSWSISEDSAGNIWFSTNGFGAFKYDGESFTQYSEKDGLTDNSVDVIMEDRKGNFWYGTRHGGVSRFDGKTFTNYTAKDSIGDNEVCAIHEDGKGNIWFSSEGFGVYCFNGRSFANYGEQQGLKVKAVQTIFEDRDGQLWVGGGGGLYRFDPSAELESGKSFINVPKNGPWE